MIGDTEARKPSLPAPTTAIAITTLAPTPFNPFINAHPEARTPSLPKQTMAIKTTPRPALQTSPDELVAVAEALIVRGKEQGFLTPGEVVDAFGEIDAEPDDLERI